ncbi:hypothetical protein HMPREF9554_01256 [Treponema phagedenis F0421]|nr:hypothetical protein HMPREF9554_01256 [Treponema phagedenis F0421]
MFRQGVSQSRFSGGFKPQRPYAYTVFILRAYALLTTLPRA